MALCVVCREYDGGNLGDVTERLDSGSLLNCPRQGLFRAECWLHCMSSCLLGKGQREMGLGWKFPYRVIISGPHSLKQIPQVFFQLGECCIKNGEGCCLNEPYS